MISDTGLEEVTSRDHSTHGISRVGVSDCLTSSRLTNTSFHAVLILTSAPQGRA